MVKKAAKKSGKAARKPSRKSVRRRGAAHAAVPAAVPSVASQLPPVTPARVKAAQRKFEEGIVARGEAVPAGAPLGPGVTHEIVGGRPDGSPILKRRRFSLR